MGQPVALEYAIDLSNYELNGQEGFFSYSILADGKSWLVGGQVSGVIKVEGSKFSCEAFRIPLVPGELSQFPNIALTHLGFGDDYLAIPLDFRYPRKFQSCPNLQEVAVAKSSTRKGG